MKCHKKMLLVCSSLLFCSLFCLLSSLPVSALELTGGNALVLDSGTIVTDVQTRNGTKSHSDLIFDFPGTESFVYGLSFVYSSTAIPDTNYLLSFDVTYISSFGSAGGSNYTGHFRYDGLESQTMNKVFESCVDNHNTPITNGGITQYIGEGQVTCSYIFFAHSDSYTSFTSRNDSRIWYGISSTNNRIIVSPGFVRGISWNGLTEDDRDWLEEVIQDSSTDVSSVVSAINNQISATNTVNNSVQEVNDSVQSLNTTMEEGNDDAQSRWEADKAEEAEREEQGQDDADELGSTFHFEIRNPFMGLLGLFTNNCPVQIPTIARLINSSTTVYRCWFSNDVRSVLTPVFGIAASVLLFGFIVRGFLRKGNFSGGIEI